MRYYAEFKINGIDGKANSGDSVFQFETKRERDEMVERWNELYNDVLIEVCRPITRKEAAKAYRVQDFDNADRCKEVSHPRTCAGRCFFEVGRK